MKLLRQALPWREPIALVQALAARLGREGLVWLDGDGSAQGRWSRVGLNPLSQRVCRGLPGASGARDPFTELAAMAEGGGHWMGWLAYGAGAWVEPGSHWLDSDLAVLWAAQHDPVLVLDHQEHTLVLEGQDPGRLKAMAELINSLPIEVVAIESAAAASPAIPLESWHWHTTPAAFAEQVRQIHQLIAAGDLFQANLTACCEFNAASPPNPLALYRRLRQQCPAPFGGLAIAGREGTGSGASGEAVLSSSPERFLQLNCRGQVETRPIKGTRPRRSPADADAAEAAALISSAKDRAENVMIVDLLRNDLGRVCQPGSIRVPQLVGLESFRQVHHLTSVVQGELEPDSSLVDLLRACWPGGSITGAPKIRACQRLSSLEPIPRGPYCGSLFWLGPDGHFDSNILIRSLVIKGQRLRVHAGCGIVADSDPTAEAEEMGWKLKPLLEALA